MDQNKSIFDYLAQVLLIFGFSMLTLNVFCVVFGDAAQGLSSMFAMGSRGLPVETAFQFLGTSVLIVGLRFIFFTDRWIRQMTLPLRTACMLGCTLLIMTVFIVRFQWFAADLWQAWVMFFACFFLSFVCSYLIMLLKERTENRKLEEALDRLKKKEAKKDE